MILAGKYRLDSLLAEGGMGSVWIATNLVLESQVAIKILHRHLIRDEVAEARLLQEARLAAQIGHRNIVHVYDFGHTDSGAPYIVMELLKGEDLGARITRKGRISAVDAVRLLLPVASALAAAHSKGIVHRDLKPENVFLALDDLGEEIPKVVDFGIAKADMTHPAARLTADGRVIGSPAYLSPEQALGEVDIDERADIWALCVTLYECITGALPFRDENYNRLLRLIIEEDPVPILEHAAGDAALWSVIRSGLAKDRTKRWQSMQSLIDALSDWLAQQQAATADASPVPSGTGSQPQRVTSPTADASETAGPQDERVRRDPSPLAGMVAASTTRDARVVTQQSRTRKQERTRALIVGGVLLVACGGVATGMLMARVSPHEVPSAAPSMIAQPMETVAPDAPVAVTAMLSASSVPVLEVADAQPALSSSAPSPVSRPRPAKRNTRSKSGAPPIPSEPNF